MDAVAQELDLAGRVIAPEDGEQGYDPDKLFSLNQSISPIPAPSADGGSVPSPHGRPGFSLDGRPAQASAS
jgi:hypothetical protein